MASFLRSHRSTLLALTVGACASGGALLFACIVADPPAELPPPPELPPSILTESAQPPVDVVLPQWPREFSVSVQVSDTSLTFYYELFVDFTESQNPVAPIAFGTEQPDPSAYDAGVRIIEIDDPPPPSSSGCHVVELLVALSFNGADPHTPGPAGASSIVWFYNPSGDLGGCPTYDAGAAADGAFPGDATGDVIILTDGGTE